MEFTDLDLHSDLQRGIAEAGFVTCMPVQEMVFGHSLSGQDIYAQSQTGTGKTAAFLVSIFQRIMTVPELRTRKVLILAPTRELAIQIEDEARMLGKHLPISMGAFYGGVAYGPQEQALRQNVQMIIGTPGRITDFLQQGKMVLKEVGFLVIDEADRMFDMGFVDDLRRLLRYLPPAKERQTFLFSATLGLRVKDIAWEYMVSPKEISIEPEHVTVDLVTQELYHTGTHEKLRLLLGILAREKPQSAIIFCNQKAQVEELARRLELNGVECEFIIGDLPQSRRTAIIDRLKAGKTEILVATDVAARGLDVHDLDLVVNYDLPDEAENYVHRIGRTARAGKSGKAVSLACEKFVYNLYDIEKFLGNKIPVMPMEDALLLEDKSVNMRFGHSRNRGPARPEGRGRPGAGRDPGERRAGSRRPDGHGRGEGRRDPRRTVPHSTARDRIPGETSAAMEGRGAKKPLAPPQSTREGSKVQAPRSQAPKGRNPYELTQDERLRMYREKYGMQAHSGGGQNGGAKDVPNSSKEERQSAFGRGKTASPTPAPKKEGIIQKIRKLFGGK